MNSKAKYFCFTINNPSAYCKSCCYKLQTNDNVDYLIFGTEGSEECRTLHYQGFVCFKKRVLGTKLKRLLGDRAHIEVAKSHDLKKSAVYCKKEGRFNETGVLPQRGEGQGRRSDLLAIRSEIIAGASARQIADDHFPTWVIHRRSFQEYRSLLAPARTFPSEVTVYFGTTGVGKTRRVVDSEPDLWISPDNSLAWFNGYIGQEAVLFDDFVGCPMNRIDFLLKLLDRYPMQVPTKGGFINWCPQRIYFTSNLKPEEWFPGLNPLRFAALLRRLKTVTEMTDFFMIDEDEKSE